MSLLAIQGRTEMSTIGQPERVTQDRVIGLLSKELGYTYLGDFQDRVGNSNVEEQLLSAYLTRCGYRPALISKALYELQRIKGRYALVTLCIGGGQGIAAIFERV